METIGHVTAHDTMRAGNIVRLAPQGTDWTVTYVRADGNYLLVSPGGVRRTVQPHKVYSVNGARVVTESEWVR